MPRLQQDPTWIKAGRHDPPDIRAGSTQVWPPTNSDFLDYCNSVGAYSGNGVSSGLQVLLQFDETSGTTTADRRTGQSTRLGTYTGHARSFKSSLNRGRPYRVRFTNTTANLTVSSFTGETGGVFTWAIMFAVRSFDSNVTLLTGAGGGLVVSLIDAGNNFTIRISNSLGTIRDYTNAVSDNWKDHLLIVSMNGTTPSTANLRVVLDGTLLTGGAITDRVLTNPTNRVLFTPVTANKWTMGSAFAEWNRQLSTNEEAGLLTACRQTYHTRKLLHGVHCGTQFFASQYHQQIVDAVKTNLAPQIVRIDLRWKNIQASSGGAYDWTLLDSVVDKYYAAGIDMLMTVAGSPTWATGGSDEFSVPAAAGFNQWVTDYQAFVLAAVQRYKTKVKKWELGNEVNFGAPDNGFWRSMRTNSTSTTTFTGGSSTTITLADASTFPTSGTIAIQKPGQTRTEVPYTGKTGNQLTGITGGTGIHTSGAYVQMYTSLQWGTDVAQWMNALRTTITTEDPTAKVCTGGLLGWGAIGTGLVGATLFFQMWNNGSQNLSTAYDAYGMHPYPGAGASPLAVQDFDNSFSDCMFLVELLYLLPPRAVNIWYTEYGWYTSSDVISNQSLTAQKVADSLDMCRQYLSKYVEMAIVFVDFDRVSSGFYGLMTGIDGLAGYSGPSLQPRTSANNFKARALDP